MMIEAKEVRKSFGTGEAAVRALRGATLSVDRGEIVAVMGPSGCGKTTLLHVLSGIEPADAGEIWIGGTPLHRRSDKEISKLRLTRMGFVFQQYHLIEVLNVLENVALPLIARGFSEKKAYRKAAEALELVGLSDKLTARPSELSGGQCQRTAIARAVAGDPEILWADELTGALDTDNARQIVGLLRRLNEALGTTVVIVTHDPNVAAAAHRIIRMENGRILPEREGAVRHV